MTEKEIQDKKPEPDFENMRFPGPEGSAIDQDEYDKEELMAYLKHAESTGDVPEETLTAFDQWAKKHELKFTKEERQAGSVVFLAGQAHSSSEIERLNLLLINRDEAIKQHREVMDSQDKQILELKKELQRAREEAFEAGGNSASWYYKYSSQLLNNLGIPEPEPLKKSEYLNSFITDKKE